ncbi:hypothetical protein GWK47_045319 [Chionoecetes opilio]|uniref:Uncharacterized protein n=1 Tax=Chionoecetes opilio TaxID=41210 RepID=A0A8J5CU92_CHIOP|nr:hypothetical protein GWK47_045319 [Chionoecetes opilio]
MCTTRELRGARADGHGPGRRAGQPCIPFTDGSVDPDSGRTGAAFVTTGGTELSWRTLKNCSTLPTELVAIQHALEHAPHHGRQLCNTHRLLDGAAGPPTADPKDNVRSSPPSQAAHRALSRREGVSGSMDPQPRRGPRVTRRRGAGPPSEPPAAPASPCTCLPAYSSSRRRARRAAAHCVTRHTENWRPGRGRRPGTLQPPTTPTGRHPATTQGRWRLLQRVRLGYCTREELQEDFEGKCGDHCEMHTRRPLVHYLLSCPPPPPEARPDPRRPACRWGAF